jgi:hypothetical protein
VKAARLAWGPAPAALLLRGAENAPWPPAARDGTLLLRAALEAEGGQDDLARADAGRVAAGTGPGAAQARLWLAALELSRVETVSDFDRIRPIVLPAVGAEDVLPLIEALRTVELLERRAEEQARPIALFAAAEVARDALGAHKLAISLFVRYADADPNSPWVGKALLAALALAPEGPEWDALFQRAEALPGNLYVNHARGRAVSSLQFAEVERSLGSELAAVLEGVSAMARERDVLVRDRSTPGVPPQA